MEAQVAQFLNKGMFQDTSISKSSNEFAYENYNIRITAVDSRTLLSVTNERMPKDSIVNIKDINGTSYDYIPGTYLGHAILNKQLVLFTKDDSYDYIIVLTLNVNRFTGDIKYKGNLKFSLENPIETLPYYESEVVQKVYWVDGNNIPRVINIKSNNIQKNNDTQFDFNPEYASIPNVTITKEYKGLGLFPSGVIQYFITYYNKYGTETGIVWSSDLNYLDYPNKAASPEDIVNCSFKLEINNVDTSFDSIRVYSLKRTSYNSEVVVNIVKDLDIKNNTTFTIIDTNQNQESVDHSILFFLGGKDFCASTLTQKDNTLFLGDIKLENSVIDDTLKTLLYDSILNKNEDDSTIRTSTLVSFNYKTIQLGETDGYYTYKRQSNEGSSNFKTFKRGEIYRFAIQFQTKTGNWTSPEWVGDLECLLPPVSNIENNTVQLANATCSLTEDIIQAASSKYHAYRLLIADTTSARQIVAQGVVCPTVFNYEERLDNTIYAESSWLMRARGGDASWQHMAPVSDEVQGTNDLMPVSVNSEVGIDGKSPINFNAKGIFLHPYRGHGCYASIRALTVTDGLWDNSKVSAGIKTIDINSSTWDSVYTRLCNFFSPYLDFETLVPFKNFKEFAKTELSSSSEAAKLGSSWHDFNFLDCESIFGKTSPDGGRGFAYTTIMETDYDSTSVKTDINFQSKKNNYYVDSTILTFHSPEVEDNKDLFDNNNLNFRIVGAVPITANYSDVEIILNTQGISKASNIDKKAIINTTNISKSPKVLTSAYIFRDAEWKQNVSSYIPDISKITNYPVFMWQKQGSITGANNECVSNEEGDSLPFVPAELKNKTFANQHFSYSTKYYSKYWKTNVTPTQYFNSDSNELKQIVLNENNKILYSGNYDNLLTFTDPYRVGKLDNYDPVRIKYKSTPHVVFGMINSNSTNDNLKLNVLPSHPDENDRYSDIYSINSKFVTPWQYSVNNPKTTKSKVLMFVKDTGMFDSESNYKNSLNNLLLNIKTYYIGENKLKNIMNADGGTWYIFLFPPTTGSYTYKYPQGISKVIKFKTDNNILTLDEAPIVGTLADFPELEGKVFNIAYFTDYKPIKDDAPNAITWDGDDFELGFNITIRKNVFGNLEMYYSDPDISYEESTIDSDNISNEYPYLYLGEFYKDINYSALYGGYENNALESITWIPSSSTYTITSTIELSEGDTYYQRWDCLKTFPATEEDTNKVVDITSFMLETHINLEGRYDNNIGTTRILTVRPTNSNLINKVYSQDNNFFSYSILDEKFYNQHYRNQITWSLLKSSTSDIDPWTNISLVNALNLDGSYGKVNKLLNFNDTIIAFQDNAISTINFNNRTALSTESGVPVEIANSGKVNGYSIISDTIGCQNKKSICKTPSGLYFIDDSSKSLFMFNKEGVTNISDSKGMSIWFKKYTTGKELITYDNLTHDVYISNEDYCLSYNNYMQSFISFYEYNDINALFNIDKESIILDSKDGKVISKLMFKGEYTPYYSMTYRVNPDPLEDKIFTNIEYIADFYVANSPDLPYSFGTTGHTLSPFNRLRVWNEYQEGVVEGTSLKKKYPNFEKKFRTWRVDIPRDRINHRDRIRNPWIMLELSKSNAPNNRMVFHNLLVKYYK